MGDGGGVHWLVRMEWCPARLSVCLPLLFFPCIIKSRSSLLVPAQLVDAGKGAVKRLSWCPGGLVCCGCLPVCKTRARPCDCKKENESKHIFMVYYVRGTCAFEQLARG